MLSEAARIGGGVEGGFTQPTGHPQANAPKPFEPSAPEPASGFSSPLPSIGPNPAITYDLETRILLFQVLDSETGEVRKQWPHEHQVEAYRRQIRETAPGGETEAPRDGQDPASEPAPEPAPPVAGAGGGDPASGTAGTPGAGEAVLA